MGDPDDKGPTAGVIAGDALVGGIVGVIAGASVVFALSGGARDPIVGGLFGGVVGAIVGVTVGVIGGKLRDETKSFFSKLREVFRDKTREWFCAHLQSLGIEVQMAPRGRLEENTYTHPMFSLGVIDIVEGPIRWVNVTKAITSDDETKRHLVFGVPDPKVRSGFPEVRLNAIPVRESEVRWAGDDFGLGIAQHLSQNVVVPTAFLESLRVDSFEIRPYPDLGCWILTVDDVLAPSKQEWDYYQSIASHLLGTPLPPNT